jgi:hypothetical protein
MLIQLLNLAPVFNYTLFGRHWDLGSQVLSDFFFGPYKIQHYNIDVVLHDISKADQLFAYLVSHTIAAKQL